MSVVGMLLAGCGELPGQEVGTYSVVATMEESTCGPSVGAEEREFDVQIRRDGEVGYWIGPTEIPIEGRIDDDGNFTFRTNDQILVREGDETTGIAPCVMDQIDVAEGTAGTDLEGSETLWIGASSYADCRDQVGLMPGQFIELPCEMEFTLRAEAQTPSEE
jgi:hypothetical protein